MTHPFPLVIGGGPDVVAIAGIVGTLLGTLVGAFLTWKLQERQLKHTDHTRFHERRLAVYADFNDACLSVAASMKVMSQPGEKLKDVSRAFSTLRLVASSAVAARAAEVHRTILGITDSTLENRQQRITEFTQANDRLIEVMRHELGTTPANA